MDNNDANSTTTDHQAVILKARDALRERGLSQAEAARQIGVSSATISQFLSNSYKGDTEEVARKLSAWLATSDSVASVTALLERIRVFTPEPPTTKAILNALHLAKAGGYITYVAAASGIGKTMAAEHFTQTQPSVWRCEFSRDTKSVYATFVEVAFALGISNLPRRPDELRREIVARLTRTHGLLICDEAQHLSDNGFEAIRTLHDRAKIGVVFAGHSDLADKIARLPQLEGRVFAPLRIGAAKPNDVDALLSAWGNGCKETRQFLRKYASQATGLRRIARAYERAALFAANEDQEIGFEHIQRAWANLAAVTLEARE
ncbi:AAA family ATPase [Methylocystis parvus]|uniref:AAA family ATPase n=1 Tax=Methylocystis parvus TaxID=134 RepID=UPI003C79290E